jgi:ribonuclease-3
LLPKAKIKELVQLLNLPEGDRSLLLQAITHTSYVNENKNGYLQDNERLEFLGDAVLELIVSEYLFTHYPEKSEGSLTKIRAAVICEHTLAKRAKIIRLGEFMLLGRGEEITGGRERNSLLADAFEAVIGALYLNYGLDRAKSFVLSQIVPEINCVVKGEYGWDYKTSLQEVVQRNGSANLHYKIVGETGPDHEKIFTVELFLDGVSISKGSGRSKKEAEQAAAELAYHLLKD